MVEIYVLQLVQAILYIGATVLFLFATIRRNDLLPWFSVYITTAVAIILNYFIVLNPSMDIIKVITNIFYFLAHFLIFSASLIELNRIKPFFFKTHSTIKLMLLILFLWQVSSQFIVISLEILMIVIMAISIVIMIYVFLKTKFGFHALIILAMCITLIITINNFFEDTGLMYSEELSPALSVFLGSVLFVAGMIAPLEDKLTLSEQKYRHLFENSPFAIILIDFKGKLVDLNPACEEMFQISREKALGKNLEDLKMIPIKSLMPIITKLQENETLFQLPPIDLELHKRDGTPFWVHWEGSKIRKDSTSLFEFIGHDISERMRMEELRIEEMKKLKDIDNIRKDLLTRVTHELKTPLMSIRGASEFLQLEFGESVGPDAVSLLEMIERGGIRLEHLISSLIDISRIEYKKLELNLEESNFIELVKEAIEELRYKINERSILLEVKAPEEIIVKLDRIRMMQVITNLLSNALKNSPPKSKISITIQKDNNWVDFIIKDQGVGLTREELSKLFKRFGKIERYEDGIEYIDIQGSGLGLYITKQIVELHKGRIEAYSEGRNKGAIFRVSLPLKQQMELAIPL